MSHTIVLIPGDGIGPEVTEATVRAVDALELGIEWLSVEAGEGAVPKHGTPLPVTVLDAIRTHRVALKGPITTPVGKGFQSVNVALRKQLDLYVSLRPVKSLEGVETPYKGVDLVVFRENTEGLYSGLEHVVTSGVVESLKIITAAASRRIARYAYEYARHEGRSRVAIVHKATIMKLSDGLFRDTALEVAGDYPFVETQDVLIDDAFMDLALDPQKFDCLVMENLYGDLLSDLCAGLVGGLGVVPGANIGDRYAVFEAVHGSAPDIAGKGIANPTALMLSAVLMLKYVGLRGPSLRLEGAIRKVLADGKHTTADLGGKATTREYTDAVIAALEV